MPPPSGLVAFLFTDIEGSTKLVRSIGDDRFNDVIDRHDRLLRRIWTEHDGFEVNNDGDSFLVAFDGVATATNAAIESQLALARTSWPVGIDLRIRAGIHVGLAYPRNDNYHALSVHQAARVMNSANGNQIYLSGDAVAELDPGCDLPDGSRLRSLGRFQVRDFEQPLALYAIDLDDHPRSLVAPRAVPAERHNLLRPATPMLDRDGARADVLGRLAPGALVSIIGTGGIGKTRLAVEIGSAVVERWPDGVWMVELDSVGSPELLVGAVARSARIPHHPGVEPWTEVLDHLRDRQLLLILDNCEHLTAASARLAAELVATAPKIGVLATSREPLGLPNEEVVRLGALGCDDHPDADIELYLERAGAAAARADRSDVTELCRWLDGVPLAIELAAARAGVLDAGELVTALRTRAERPAAGHAGPFLRSNVGSSFRPGRHRSLDDLLDWSYELLGPEEQLLLRRLSIFNSPVDLDLVACLAAVGDTGLDRYDAAELLWSLSSKSLVVVDESAGASRFRVVRSIRPPLTARLDTAEWNDTVSAAARHHLDRVGPDQVIDGRWVGRVGADLDNIRTVLTVESDLEPSIGQMLAWSLGRHADVIGEFELGIEELTGLIDRLTEPTPERVALLTLLADLHLRVGRLAQAERAVADAVALHTEVGAPTWDDGGLARSRGDIELRHHRPARAKQIAEQRLRDPISLRARARLWNLIGLCEAAVGDERAAIHAFGNELERWEDEGLESSAVVAHGNLAEMHLRAGDWRQAAHHQRRSLELAGVLGHPVAVVFSLIVAARLAAEGQRWELAVRLQASADEMGSQLGIVLYDLDAELRTSLLVDATARIGAERVRDLEAEGRALAVDDAISIADEVLSETTGSVTSS